MVIKYAYITRRGFEPLDLGFSIEKVLAITGDMTIHTFCLESTIFTQFPNEFFDCPFAAVHRLSFDVFIYILIANGIYHFQFGRWSLLLSGVLYGAFHHSRLSKKEAGIREVEAKQNAASMMLNWQLKRRPIERATEHKLTSKHESLSLLKHVFHDFKQNLSKSLTSMSLRSSRGFCNIGY